MIINRRSLPPRVGRWLACILLLADTVAAALLVPPADAPLWADLARVCATDSSHPDSPAPGSDHRLCLYCLPLMAGGGVAPDPVVTPAPHSFAVAFPIAARAGSCLAATARAHLARGPPSA